MGEPQVRAAVIDDTGTVTNVILVEDLDFDAGEDVELVELPHDSQAAPGWTYAGEFIKPEEND